MRPQGRTEQVVRGTHVGHPVAERFIDRILQRTAPRLHRDDPTAEQTHPKDVQGLALDVLAAHVDLAREAEQRGRGGGGDAVLAGARLGHQPLFLHADGKQCLAEDVVDLVGACVTEILALEEDTGTTVLFGQPSREVEWRGPTRIVAQEVAQAGVEATVPSGCPVGTLQLDERLHQRLRNEASSVDPEVPTTIRQLGHQPACWASVTKRRTLAGSFRPGTASTPEFTSTA
jgi:hypothetical protein